MTTPVLSDYGLGVTLMERGGRPIVTHGGANEGFECRFVAFFDGSRQGLVVMTNGDNGGVLAAAIQRLVQAMGEDTLGPLPARPGKLSRPKAQVQLRRRNELRRAEGRLRSVT